MHHVQPEVFDSQSQPKKLEFHDQGFYLYQIQQFSSEYSHNNFGGKPKSRHQTPMDLVDSDTSDVEFSAANCIDHIRKCKGLHCQCCTHHKGLVWQAPCSYGSKVCTSLYVVQKFRLNHFWCGQAFYILDNLQCLPLTRSMFSCKQCRSVSLIQHCHSMAL